MLSGVVSAGVAADTVTTLIIAERTEGRMRFTHPVLVNEPNSPAYDADTTPSLRLQVEGPHWEGTLGGAYTFTEANIGQNDVGPDHARFQSAQSLGSGVAGIGWHSKRARIYLEETGNYGQLNLSYLAPTQSIPSLPGTPPPSAQPTVIPRYVPATILVLGSHTNLTMSGVLDRTWAVGFTAGYSVAGGADLRSRNISEGGLAEEYTPSAKGTLTYRFDRHDDGTLIVGGRHTQSRLAVDPSLSVPGSLKMPTHTFVFPTISGPGPTSDEIDASATWRRTISREVESSVNLGGALVREESVGPAAVASSGFIPDTGWIPVPTGHALLGERFGLARLRGTASEAIYAQPAVDLISGAVTFPLTGIADLSITERTRRYSAEAGLTRAMPLTKGNRAGLSGPVVVPSYWAVQGNVQVVQAFGKRFELSGGVRFLWQLTDAQNVGGTTVPGQEFDSQIVFVAFTYHEPPARL